MKTMFNARQFVSAVIPLFGIFFLVVKFANYKYLNQRLAERRDLFYHANNELMRISGLSPEEFEQIHRYENIAYQSGKYGTPSYVSKILVGDDRVLDFRMNIEIIGDAVSFSNISIRDRVIKSYTIDSEGRPESVEYGVGGDLSIFEFQGLLKAEVIYDGNNDRKEPPKNARWLRYF